MKTKSYPDLCYRQMFNVSGYYRTENSILREKLDYWQVNAQTVATSHECLEYLKPNMFP